MAAPWSIADARRTYAVPHWSDGYFDIDARGDLIARPRGAGGPAVALAAVVERARGEGLRLPLLLRFPDILRDRVRRLQDAFARACAEHGYAGGYTAVYPIKVNQQRAVAGELAAVGGDGFGTARMSGKRSSSGSRRPSARARSTMAGSDSAGPTAPRGRISRWPAASTST